VININIVNDSLSDISFLEPKDNLNPKFWQNDQLDEEVSKQLQAIVDDVIHSMEIKAEVKDIIITGSTASYNWHDLSDIDLHIMFSFGEIDKNLELVKRMLDQSRINWNKTHDIMIRDHEVEIYFQDVTEPHEANGIWSLKENKWIAEPVKLNPDLDLRNAEKKAETIAKSIDHALDLYDQKKNEQSYNYASKIKTKISNMRTAGLSRDGIYSPENLAFKMLRNSNYLEKLSDLKVKAYDNMMSLTEIYVKDYFNEKKDSDHFEFEGQYNLDDLLDPSGPAPWGKIDEDQ
jgi:predicted nucleotidyltransferase|tara:strand:- start:7121 stop:7990 length:870 start_codon:yes stop_codon:yes gene_type:complete